MTVFIADVARWQRDLPLSELVKADFGAVNIKTSHGTVSGAPLYPGQADDLARAKEARGLGLRICTFHWLDNSAAGATQARVAFDRMKALGGPAGMAHQVDCEDEHNPATWKTWTEYVTTMQGLLGRPIFAYTGRWWWVDPRYGFNARPGATYTPYLWAAPNTGYLGSYPGDTSTHWKAGYGGWATLAAMQYAVAPPFGPGVTTKVDISKTALRDLAVWKACAGVAW